MKKLVSLTALVIGVLFFLFPRYILPACEYAGYPRMHCSDTAQGEYMVGAGLIVVSGMTFFVKWKKMPLVSAILSIPLFCLAFWLPNYFGYCHSPKMPCTYGKVPAVRLFSTIGILIMLGAIFGIAQSYRKKGNP